MTSPIADMIGRIQSIQTQLGLTPTQAATTATDGTAFADELTSAQAGSVDATTATDTAGGVTGDAVVADARKYLGVPYVWGGTNPATGLDCSGLVQRVYADLGIDLPRVAADQATRGQPVPSLAQAQPGDLLAFDQPVDHIAIYIGNGQMIAAPKPGDHVKIESVYKTPSAIRRIVGMGTGSAASLRPASLTGTGGLSSVPYANLFTQAGAKYGVSPKLLAAIAKVESNYDAGAVSPAGAQGLMQLMPATAQGLGVNPLDPAQAVDGAARTMAGLLQQFGSQPLALAAYNAGAGAVRRYGGIPPFAETQAYVPKVLAALAALG